MIEVRPARKDELADCIDIRRRVFMEEQGVTEEEEIDGLDEESQQFIARVAGEPAGTARLRVIANRTTDGPGPEGRIERLAVLKDHRGLGLGDLIMDIVEATARDQGNEEVVLHAQVQVIPFYQRRGYVAFGDLFLDARIEHRAMRLVF